MKLRSERIDRLTVHVYDSRISMGQAAGREATERIKRIIRDKGTANIIFAAAPSQNDLFASLLESDIDWSRVRAFQQDEYIGISQDEPAGFGNFLRRTIYDKAEFKEVHYLLSDEDSVQEKMLEYEELLMKYPPDLSFLGVGENGHLAFNDPPVADFEDPKRIKIVELEKACRQQQVNDACFTSLDEVPAHALTLTLSFIGSVPEAICVVPNIRKAEAIRQALRGPVSTECPATLLRTLRDAVLYLDADSASLAFSA